MPLRAPVFKTGEPPLLNSSSISLKIIPSEKVLFFDEGAGGGAVVLKVGGGHG